MPYTVGTLFSGIGVPDLCAELLGMQTVWAVEKELYCQKVLRRHFPHLAIHGDIFDVSNLPYVDFVIAGFPCQPFSSAGTRKGEKDPRYLVPEMLRVLKEIKPRVILLENVPGFSIIDDGNTFKQLLRALAEMGYDAEWCHLRASDFGAPHRRERWFLVAYAVGYGDSKCWARKTDSHEVRYSSALKSRWQHQQHGIIASSSVGDTSPISRSQQSKFTNRKALVKPVARTASRIERRNTSARVSPRNRVNTSSASDMGNTYSRRRRQRNTQQWGLSFSHEGRSIRNHREGTAQSRLGRTSHGITYRLDEIGRFPARPGQSQHAWEPPRVIPSGKASNRTNRLKALGNSMVVPVVYAIMQSVLTWLQEQDKAIAA